MYIFNNITKSVRILACVALTTGTVSCSYEEFDSPSKGIECRDGAISVLYEVEGDIPVSRGIEAIAHETKLKEVYILYFDNETGSDNFDTFVGYTITTASEGTSTLRFDPPANFKNDHDYRLLVAGNADAYAEGDIDRLSVILDKLLDPDKNDTPRTYSNVREEILAEYETAVSSTVPGRLPMCGRFVNKSTDQEMIFRIHREADSVTIPEDCIFRFQRAICRIDLHNLVGDVLDIRYVRPVNTRSLGAYFFDGINQGEMHDINLKANGFNKAYIALPDSTQEKNLQRLEAEMYCFPNTVNTCLPNDTKTTALLIAGYYKDPDSEDRDKELTYYRFNINNAGTAQALQRNYCYRATIKGVKQRGYSSEDKAYNATSPIFNYEVSEEWDIDDDNVVTDADGNFLVVSKSLITFDGDQCGADVVKLTVNTAAGMTWDLKMDENTKEYFQAQKIDGAPGETIKAFTCGPTSVNHTNYYREGKLIITAKNKVTGNELRKEVRLVQLTTKGDVKCLIVNDYMSDFAQQVSEYGQTISYKVITGNPTNQWRATEVGSVMSGWEDKISFTQNGTNGNYFTITFPAYINKTDKKDEKREVSIKFEFVTEDPEVKKQIQPIIVKFTQYACDKPLSIEGWPTDGELVLNCFDTTTGWQTANGVAQSRMFTVHLQRPELHYFTVTSSFDQYRDLSLNDYIGLPGLGQNYKSVHPGNYVFFNGYAKDTYTSSHYNKELKNRTSSNPSFYINAFRMGPGDPDIEGTITVTVYDKDNNPVPDGELILTVRLVVPSEEYILNDVMIENPNNGWIYIMDRNMGCPTRMQVTGEQEFANKAMWCYLPMYNPANGINYTSAWKITNTTNDERWLGHSPLEYPWITTTPSHENKTLTSKIPSWKNEMKLIYSHLGEMYAKAEEYPWMPTSPHILDALKNNTCVSKGRYFILADPKVCPVDPFTKKKKHVACWLPSGCGVSYINMTDAKKIAGPAIVLFCGRNVEEEYFYGVSSHVDARFVARLIRMSYMIGHKTLNSEWTLPESEIDNQIKEYKKTILQCYGKEWFEEELNSTPNE